MVMIQGGLDRVIQLGQQGMRVQSRSVAGFDPTTIAGLKLWLKADAGLFQDSAGTTPATADNDPVGRWGDQSGQGNHVIQATSGNRPALKTAVINGLPVVRGDGVNDYLATTVAISSIISVGAYTAFSVFRPITITSNSANIYLNDAVWADTVAGGPYAGMFLRSTPVAQSYNWDGSEDGQSVAIALTTPVIVMTQHNGGNLYLQKNNGAATSVASGNTEYLAGTLGVGRSTSHTSFANTDYAELLFWNVALSAGNIASVLAYLNTKWAVY